MVYKWCTEFRCGSTSLNDAKHPGLPKEVTSQEIIFATLSCCKPLLVVSIGVQGGSYIKALSIDNKL